MLDTIKNFLQSISDMLLTAWDFLLDLFDGIAYLVKMLGKFVGRIPQYFSWLPVEVVAVIGTAFVVVVALRVIGKDE